MSAENGQEPLLFIRNDQLAAGITTFGAALWDLRLTGYDGSLVLGFETVADYLASRTYAGAVVGRVCNRLGNGRARLGAATLELDRNVPPYHLHGGATGFSQQRWHVIAQASDSVTLGLESLDGHEGYPGNLSVRARYSVKGATLRLDFTATSDAPTLVNLCHHAYFNLSREKTIDDHLLWLSATEFLQVDADLVPTGIVESVEGTPADFRTARRMRDPQGRGQVLNHTMILARSPRPFLSHAATVVADRRMQLWTTQPALHLYEGYRISEGTPLRGGGLAGPRSGFCLEAQGWTDAPNHPGFPSIELLPQEEYSHATEYRFD